MNKKEVHFNYSEGVIEDLDLNLQNLVKRANNASNMAYAPYSLFYVGAAILLEDGTIVTGNNQENVAYPSGLCAERVAIFSAAANYPNAKIKAIAVAAHNKDMSPDTIITPCGSCRQAMAEYEQKQEEPIRIILCSNNGKVKVIENISTLLPLMFEAKQLIKKA